ncbi:hypothetical protein T8T21_15110 [Limimaricola variabilis]|nr:hypothetical protein [Limimaricola variabilis]WPY94414.1 hypothetical protein T8T21_15110 [Limimaricola variabilis]
MTLLLVLILVALSMAGLALGLLARRGPLSGGCGRACDGCRKTCNRRSAL